jgi:maltose alpha-D-glucosyltransferase / alpha-amylase
MIGKRLGEMHAVLARPSDDPAFAPERAAEQDAEVWTERALSLLRRALTLVRDHKKWDDETVAARAKRLLSQQEALEKVLHRLARSGAGSFKTRIHGDFHLGQVIVASGDVYIIDFEGEPGRPLAERRAKASPLRDVAGLMRSFDYAAATTLDPKNVTAARLDAETRESFLTRLRDSAQEAFLAAYFESAGSEQERNAGLLDFFLIEKAAYELVYEAANRPAWLPIPLNGIARLADRILRSTARSAA